MLTELSVLQVDPFGGMDAFASFGGSGGSKMDAFDPFGSSGSDTKPNVRNRLESVDISCFCLHAREI
jgi:hypothetical protein